LIISESAFVVRKIARQSYPRENFLSSKFQERTFLLEGINARRAFAGSLKAISIRENVVLTSESLYDLLANLSLVGSIDPKSQREREIPTLA